MPGSTAVAESQNLFLLDLSWRAITNGYLNTRASNADSSPQILHGKCAVKDGLIVEDSLQGLTQRGNHSSSLSHVLPPGRACHADMLCACKVEINICSSYLVLFLPLFHYWESGGLEVMGPKACNLTMPSRYSVYRRHKEA